MLYVYYLTLWYGIARCLFSTYAFERHFGITYLSSIVGLFFPFIGLEFKNGGSYVWQSGNTTESNMFDNWANKVFPEGGSCVYIDSRPNTYKWRDSSEDSCNYTKYFNYICESRYDLIIIY